MAFGNKQFTKTDLFIKSAAADLQDPTFLTFDIDFFPPPEEYPRYDGLWNSSLLPTDATWFGPYSNHTTPPTGSKYFTVDNGTGEQIARDDQYKNVEFSAYEWLLAYYGKNYGGATTMRVPHPAQALIRMAKELSVVQDAPWYFQSILGITDLWKQAHRVKEGDMKTTLTINCLESVRRPLTTIAENYRWAVYDQERLSYRLPDNLRWFDMNISLLEARNLVDHDGGFSLLPIGRNNSVKLFEYDSNRRLTRGLKVTTFKCKMCEFDFSDFLSGGGTQNEFTIATSDRPFSPAFKINVGWVMHEEVDYEDSELMRQGNVLTSALNAIGNRLTRVLTAASGVPGAIASTLVNRAQTAIMGAALGNAYSGLNALATSINDIGTGLGRVSPVGPASALNERIYSPVTPGPRVGRDDIGDAYLGEQAEVFPGSTVGTLSYDPLDPVSPVNEADIGDAYIEDRQDQVPISSVMTQVYEPPVRPSPVGPDDLGDIYETLPDSPPVGPNDIGDVYP